MLRNHVMVIFWRCLARSKHFFDTAKFQEKSCERFSEGEPGGGSRDRTCFLTSRSHCQDRLMGFPRALSRGHVRRGRRFRSVLSRLSRMDPDFVRSVPPNFSSCRVRPCWSCWEKDAIPHHKIRTHRRV